MLTVLIETHDHEAELAETLSVLVAGAVEGLISDVLILDHGSEDGTAMISDAAGCRMLSGWTLPEAIASARGEWLLVLEPGARPLGRWVEDIADYLGADRPPARFSLPHYDRSPLWTRLLRLVPPLEYGLLISKRQALAASKPGMGLGDLARRLSPRALRTELSPARLARSRHGAHRDV